MKYRMHGPGVLPLADIERLRSQINNLFDRDMDDGSSGLFDRSSSPRLDVVETDDSIMVDCDVPGVDAKDIELDVTNDVLSIRGEKHRSDANERDVKNYRRETWYGSFQRTRSLPNSIDSNKVNTEMTKQNQSSIDTATEREGSGRRKIYPAYEVWEQKEEILLRLEMPGLERDDVELSVENNQLIIQGQRPDWNVDGEVLIRERRVGDYQRVFTLDKTVDTEKINATMKNGVLEIELGHAREAQPRRIEIKTS